MAMISQNKVEAILNAGPDTGSVEYRNAWATVAARLARTSEPSKRAEWIALQSRLDALGAPVQKSPMSRQDALGRAQEANEARSLGRCRASILRQIADAKYQRVMIADGKPWVFEAALQMIEDGTVSMHSCTHDYAERGPAAVEGRRKIRRLILAPHDPAYTRECPWVSRKKQAEAEARI